MHFFYLVDSSLNDGTIFGLNASRNPMEVVRGMQTYIPIDLRQRSKWVLRWSKCSPYAYILPMESTAWRWARPAVSYADCWATVLRCGSGLPYATDNHCSQTTCFFDSHLCPFCAASLQTLNYHSRVKHSDTPLWATVLFNKHVEPTWARQPRQQCGAVAALTQPTQQTAPLYGLGVFASYWASALTCINGASLY